MFSTVNKQKISGSKKIPHLEIDGMYIPPNPSYLPFIPQAFNYKLSQEIENQILELKRQALNLILPNKQLDSLQILEEEVKRIVCEGGLISEEKSISLLILSEICTDPLERAKYYGEFADNFYASRNLVASEEAVIVGQRQFAFTNGTRPELCTYNVCDCVAITVKGYDEKERQHVGGLTHKDCAISSEEIEKFLLHSALRNCKKLEVRLLGARLGSKFSEQNFDQVMQSIKKVSQERDVVVDIKSMDNFSFNNELQYHFRFNVITGDVNMSYVKSDLRRELDCVFWLLYNSKYQNHLFDVTKMNHTKGSRFIDQLDKLGVDGKRTEKELQIYYNQEANDFNDFRNSDFCNGVSHYALFVGIEYALSEVKKFNERREKVSKFLDDIFVFNKNSESLNLPTDKRLLRKLRTSCQQHFEKSNYSVLLEDESNVQLQSEVNKFILQKLQNVKKFNERREKVSKFLDDIFVFNKNSESLNLPTDKRLLRKLRTSCQQHFEKSNYSVLLEDESNVQLQSEVNKFILQKLQNVKKFNERREIRKR